MAIRNFIHKHWIIGALAAIVVLVGVSKTDAATSITQSLFTLGGASNQQIMPAFPSWNISVPLAPPVAVGTATTTGSLGTGSLPIYLKVVAVNAAGVTAPSNEIATTTSRALTSAININITAIPGATSYRLYFGTTTPNSQNAYFATTSTSMTLTSTSSPTAYGAPQTYPTAFSMQTGSSAPSISFNGRGYQMLSTTTAAIGGSALAAGACATTDSTFLGTNFSSTTAAVTTPKADPGAAFYWKTVIQTATIVRTSVCNAASSTMSTPASTAYNVIIL